MRDQADSVDTNVMEHCEFFLNNLHSDLNLASILALFEHDPVAAHSGLLRAKEMISEKRRVSEALLQSLKNTLTRSAPEISVLDDEQVVALH